MNKKNKDIKFLIYQSLYIFLISVVAIKGADINLDEVEVKKMLEPNHSYIDTVNNVILSRSEYANLMQKPDDSKYVIVERSQLDQLQKEGKIVNSTSINDFKSNITSSNPPNTNISMFEKEEVKSETPVKKIPQFPPGNLNLTQYTTAGINNPSDENLEVIGLGMVPPKSAKTFEIGGQSTLVMKIGDESKSYSVKPNEKPIIDIQKMASMGEDIGASQLQRSVCFRVKVTDDFPGQLDVKFSGPVTVDNKGNGVYDIKMNAFGSKAAYENFTENRTAPYSIGFNIIVTDKKAGHNITRQQSFVFGDW